MRAAKPYRFDAWPKVARAEATTLRLAARRLPIDEAIATEAETMLGAPLSVTPLPLEACPAATLAESLGDPLVAIVLDDGRAGSAGRVALELDPWLAAVVIDRALGGSGGADVAVPVGPLLDAERGVLAYVAARLLIGNGARHRVRSVITTPGALIDAVGDRGAVAWPLEVALGADRGVVRAWLGRDTLDALPAREGRGSGRGLGALELVATADVGRATLPAADVGSLRQGDVVVLDEAWARPAAAGGGLSGEARVRVWGATRTTWRAALGRDELRVVARDTSLDEPRAKGRHMPSDSPNDDAVHLAGDAPIELAVELARFTISLAELAAVRPGEVLLTGRAVGERVVLRAGERAVAIGELVDVDGEVGVRVLAVGDQK